MADEGPSADREQRHARERQHDRTERVEEMLQPVAELLGERKYPATSEELAVAYGDQEMDLPNETESLGSVFDRLVEERFESADEAREAVYDELTGEAAGPEEYNDERDLSRLDDEGPRGDAELGQADRPSGVEEPIPRDEADDDEVDATGEDAATGEDTVGEGDAGKEVTGEDAAGEHPDRS